MLSLFLLHGLRDVVHKCPLLSERVVRVIIHRGSVADEDDMIRSHAYTQAGDPHPYWIGNVQVEADHHVVVTAHILDWRFPDETRSPLASLAAETAVDKLHHEIFRYSEEPGNETQRMPTRRGGRLLNVRGCRLLIHERSSTPSMCT